MKKRIEQMIADAEKSVSKTATQGFGSKNSASSAIHILLPGSYRFSILDTKRKSDKAALAYLRVEHYVPLRGDDPLSMTGTILPARDDKDICVKTIPIIADENGGYAIDHLLRTDGPARIALKNAALL